MESGYLTDAARKIPNEIDIFQLGEYYGVFPLISERLKKTIIDARLTGFDFILPEAYHD